MSVKVDSKSEKLIDDTIIQLHWQNRSATSETELVAQGGDFQSTEEMFGWINRMVREKRDECPDGWCPMICDKTSEFFVWAKST